MRKLIYWVHTSIDGRIAGPSGEFDWPALTPELSDYSHQLDDRVDTFLYGRVVWDLMSSYWPTADQVDDDPHSVRFAPIWRSTPKVVFSRSLRTADWGARVLSDVSAVRELKSLPGKDMLLTGGAEVAAALAAQDLIDEYQVVVHPVVLGGGKQLFPITDRVNLKLAETRTFDNRAVLLNYTHA